MTITSAISELEKKFKDLVFTNKAEIDLHGQNETGLPVAPPDAVLYPQNTSQVSKIIEICNQHECPVTAYGIGSSLEGHHLAIRGGVSLDMSKMNKIMQINDEDMDVIVQPGITRKALNEALKSSGLFFSVDPGADASIGGMAATRASGTTTVKYGTMKENVIALEAVLADGRVIRTGTRARKSSSGYDLTKLLIGAEGTLGVITELTLKLHPLPEKVASAVCSFADIKSAVDSAILIMQSAIPIARIELIDQESVQAFNKVSEKNMRDEPHLFMEFHGSPASVNEQISSVEEIINELGGTEFLWATKTEDRNALWQMRHNAFYSVKSMYPDSDAISTDVCVPISKLSEVIEETVNEIKSSGIPGPILGHVGDGNFHSLLVTKKGNLSEKKTALKLAENMSKRAIAFGGTCTGEHGIGMGKIKFMNHEHGEAWNIMGDIKRTLDPKNILNPGKLFSSN